MSSSNAWAGKTVLIVDDSALVREELSMLYREVGMKVLDTAVHGVDALAKLERVCPDLVSVDIVMPEMNGIDLYRAIAARYAEVRMVLV